MIQQAYFDPLSDAIVEKIKEAGFEISMMKQMQLSEEQAKAFYREHEGQDYFEALVKQMTRWVNISNLSREILTITMITNTAY